MPSSAPVVIVTGASRGLGHAVALSLLTSASPPNLVLVARTAAPLAELWHAHQDRVRYLAADVTAPDVAARVVALALLTWGRLDGLLLNHGVLGPVGKVADGDVAAWGDALQVNFLSCVSFIQASLPHLRTSVRGGRVVLTSSGAAQTAYPTWGAYGAGKAALNHLALTLAAEEPAVTTIAIRPGVVDTAMQDEIRALASREGDDGMDRATGQRFLALKAEGKLLDPAVVGRLMGRLVLGPGGEELSGRFLSWNDPALEAFQDHARPTVT
ncbi:MAG: hypothetical protein M1832_000703 [Thelocarpon impressellum]|nr:MAG: hypothetical protein M1832_000703 [Thelocarpon impressellum]